jgi:GDP-L-fucose synthase
MLLAQQIAYKKQFNYNSIHLLPVNLYGPKDKFDDEHSHVIPALIKKIDKALDDKTNFIEVWGTGDETREFLYVEDCARAIVLAAEKYQDVDPVNLGSGFEISISDLVTLISNLMGYTGKAVFINNGLGGQQRRVLDVSKAKEKFGFVASTDFITGLKNTIKYFYDFVKIKKSC